MQKVQSCPNSKKQVKKIEKKYSHLYLQDKRLKSIPKLSPSKETSVLYIYNNCLKTIDNLEGFPNLTCLYLQNNSIDRIENLGALKKLKKLYLGHNRISILEGLQTNEQLEELHMEKQSLPDGTPLCFDPRTVIALSYNLLTLNVSNNNISSITSLAPLVNLRSLDASHNDLDDINEVCATISRWYYLQEADFTGNVFTKQHRHREKVIGASMSLTSLNGKEISDITRVFVKRFEKARLVRSKQHVTS